MASLFLIVPGRIDGRTGGYEYDRRIVAGLRRRGSTVDVREIGGRFPSPTDHELADSADVLRGIPDGALVLVDGLAFGAMPLQIEREAARLRFAALVHMPLADAVGLDPEVATRLRVNERRALACARVVIVTGERTIEALASYGVSPDRIALVEPGTDQVPVARGSGGEPVHIVCVAAVTAGKGHRELFEALAALDSTGWRATCAGNCDRDPATVGRLRAYLETRRLSSRVSLVGELDTVQLAALLDEADVFALATLSETYGMAVAEALARGLPVVSTTTGAIPKLVGTEAGLLVAPGDVSALTNALSRVLKDGALRAKLATGAREVRKTLPTWENAVERLERALLIAGG